LRKPVCRRFFSKLDNYTIRTRSRIFLANSIPAGATVKLQKGGDGINYLVDFIELEPIPQAVAFNPATMRSVTEFGAVPNDGQDDLSAFNSARIALQSSGRSLYIPAGTFNLGSTWHIETNISIQGAGVWYTTLYFTSTGSGGIVGNGDNVKLRDFYMNGENTTRTEYKGLTGGYGNNSIIERLWIEHFETGAWITTWTGAITNGLRVSFCRFRNNYADGINLSRGSSNCIVEQCDMRNNGDDAMATWSAFDGPQQCFNNEFRYCTAENTWRAGGIGFFGGGGHKGHHLLIKDSTENGIRINSDFPTVGNSFSSTLWIEVYETTVIGCGTNANLWHNRYGAVDIFTRLYNVQNFRLINVDIQGSQKDAVMIYDVASAFRISNIEFINVTLNGAGLDGNINNYTPGTYDDYAGYGIYALPDTDGSMTITNTNICNAPSGQTRNDSGATFRFGDYFYGRFSAGRSCCNITCRWRHCYGDIYQCTNQYAGAFNSESFPRPEPCCDSRNN
jgi:Alpha-1,3-glucanase catalytic domain D2